MGSFLVSRQAHWQTHGLVFSMVLNHRVRSYMPPDKCRSKLYQPLTKGKSDIANRDYEVIIMNDLECETHLCRYKSGAFTGLPIQVAHGDLRFTGH